MWTLYKMQNYHSFARNLTTILPSSSPNCTNTTYIRVYITYSIWTNALQVTWYLLIEYEKYSTTQAHSQNCGKGLLASSCVYVCPPALMEQLGSHWTDFHEIWCMRIFRQSVEKKLTFIKIWKNMATLHEDVLHLVQYRVDFFLKWGIFQTKVAGKIETQLMFKNCFKEIVTFVRQCGKTWWSSTDHRWQFGACAFHAGYLMLQTHTHKM